MTSINPTIERAVECHKSGDLGGAGDICRQLIKEDPKDVESLHLLGVVLNDAGLYEQAIEFLSQALNVGGPNSAILHNYGVALQQKGELVQAARAFRHAADAAPLRTDSWYNLGEVELLRGHSESAVRAFERVLEQDPRSLEAQNNLGIALRQSGRLQDALDIFQTIVKNNPKDAAAQNNIGITLTELSQLEAAKIAFQTALGVAPDYADAHYNLGNVYMAEPDYERAAECYLHAIALETGNSKATYHLAICRQKQNSYDQAISLLDQLNPSERRGARANVLRDMGRFDEALADIDVALGLFPEDIKLLGNQALILQHAGQLNQAIKIYREALKTNPDSEQLQSNLAQALLLDGQFEEGWRQFEGRLQVPTVITKRENLPGAVWQGEDLDGKHLLLWCEQGLGDTIQFIRYLPLVETKAERVTLISPDRLVRLLRSFESGCNIVGEGEAAPVADFNAPLMSLPHLLDLNEIPAKTPYLAAEPDLVEAWAKKLGANKKPCIGINWQGNPNYEADHQRSVAFKLLEPMLAMPDFQFVSLQKGFGQDQIKDQSAKIFDLGDELDIAAAFVDSAAVIANLDLVITSDTAIPHLAGALGKPVWLMLPETPDWRWLRDRPDSPWYPTMRVFRQTTANDWASVVDQVIEALGKKDYL